MDFILHLVSIMVLEDQPTVEHADHFINFLDLVALGSALSPLWEVGRCTEDMDMAEMVVLLEDQLQTIHMQDGFVIIVITQDINLE